MLTLERKALKKAATKEVFAILEELKTFYGRTIQKFKWKVAERQRITHPRHKKTPNEETMEEVERQEKNGSGFKFRTPF